VTRVGGQPSITISADVLGQNTGSVSADLQKKIADLSLPAGVTVAYGGITSQLSTGFSGLLLALLAAVVLVYVVMALTFGSLIDPFILLFALPLAAIGAFPALLVTHRTLSVSAMIGLLMLVGIVVTNAIVLLDMVKQRERQGMSTRDALLAGGRIRVRPILMTALATILATLPIVIGGGDGSFIAGELGTVVVGGLLTSTLLTLLVVPVLYSAISGMKRRLGFGQGQMEDEADGIPAGLAPAAAGWAGISSPGAPAPSADGRRMMKRVRVTRRLMADGRVMEEQVAEERVPADADAQAAEAELRARLQGAATRPSSSSASWGDDSPTRR